MALQMRAPLAWAADVSRRTERYSQQPLRVEATGLALTTAPQALRQTTPRPLSRKAEATTRANASSVSATGGLQGSRLPDQFQELASQEELDEVLEEASRNGQLVLVEWMAQWCRKCIYLKPKIEKLVNEYPSVRCCVVDVNKVPYSFVKEANIAKMPTLQLWEKGERVEELIGGEAAWQVLDNVRAMIKRHV